MSGEAARKIGLVLILLTALPPIFLAGLPIQHSPRLSRQLRRLTETVRVHLTTFLRFYLKFISLKVREHERSVERLRQQYEDCLQDVRIKPRLFFLLVISPNMKTFHFFLSQFCFCVLTFIISVSSQMQQRNSAVVDMESKLNEMKSKSEECTDKVNIVSHFSYFYYYSYLQRLSNTP